MKLIRAVSCWGNEASPLVALELACDWGFEAVEGPLSENPTEFAKAAADHGKKIIVEISTGCPTGSYVPALDSTPTDHLEDFRRKLAAAQLCDPLKITVLAGADFWDFPTTCHFYNELFNIADAASAEICIETHRARPTFHPQQSARLLTEFPQLRLTLDISHWCVVCERAVAEILSWMQPIEPRVGHIHARVGYDQGPQVPNPQATWHQLDLASHLACWQRIATWQLTSDTEFFTVTPEFGPDGYLHLDPQTGHPIADLRSLNRWMGDFLKTELNLSV